jgi:hypothetical protein
MLLLVEAMQTLLDRPGARHDLLGMLGDFSRYARHIRGLPRKDVFIGAEEVDERAFLFGGERSANSHLLVIRVIGVDEGLFDALRRLKGSGGSFEVGRLLQGFLPDDREFLGGIDTEASLQLSTLHWEARWKEEPMLITPCGPTS